VSFVSTKVDLKRLHVVKIMNNSSVILLMEEALSGKGQLGTHQLMES
jgi:hypothetical protein